MTLVLPRGGGGETRYQALPDFCLGSLYCHWTPYSTQYPSAVDVLLRARLSDLTFLSPHEIKASVQHDAGNSGKNSQDPQYCS